MIPQKAAVFFPNLCRNHCHKGMLITAETWKTLLERLNEDKGPRRSGVMLNACLVEDIRLCTRAKKLVSERAGVQHVIDPSSEPLRVIVRAECSEQHVKVDG